MAKITRYNGNLQAPASAAPGTERTLFGSVSQSDDLTAQFNADMLRGWGIVGPSDQPTLQDFNAVGFALGQLLAYLHQMGVAEWNSGQEYHIGSLATVNGILFSSTIDNNTGNDPSTSSTQWKPESTGSTSVAMTNANVTLTPLQAAQSVIIVTGALTANVQLIFPLFVKQWQVINATTGNFTLTCKTAAGTGVLVSATKNIVGDGTNIVSPNDNFLLPGVVGTSRNATMRVTSPTATGTFTADHLVVARSLTGQKFLLSNISENINLATTGAGGMDTGLAPVSGYVALYVIYNSTTGAVDLLGRDVTSILADEVYGGANMPAGYTASALVAVVPTNASRQFVSLFVNGRSVDIPAVTVLNASSVQRVTATQLSISSAVPINAIKHKGVVNIGSTVSSSSASNISGGGDQEGQQSIAINSPGAGNVTGSYQGVPIRRAAPQTLFYTATTVAGTMSVTIAISGYDF